MRIGVSSNGAVGADRSLEHMMNLTNSILQTYRHIHLLRPIAL